MEGARRETLHGRLVDGHELVRMLASGGMGDVYLARHAKLGVHRAIKVICANQRIDPKAVARFEREARVLARLQHNSIVQIVEVGHLDEGWPYLLMEYVDGPSLDQLLEVRGQMRLPDALAVLEQIANALAFAHAANVIHRDLKPANVLLRNGELRQVKIIDFGLAHIIDDDTVRSVRLTEKGQIVGSPLFMAPEQAQGVLDITPAVDVYALAAVGYLLITGDPPFPIKKPIELMHAHTTKTPPRLSERHADLPPMLDDLLFACLSKEPHQRPTAAKLANHLARLERAAAADAALDDTELEQYGDTMLQRTPRD